MRAVLYSQLDKIEMRDLDMPVIASDEVLVRTRASGICHTDIEVLKGRYGSGAFPLVPGHEYAGEIVEVGSSVTGFATGDRVVVDPNISCGECRACHKGLTNLCVTLGAYGVSVNGGFEEFSAVSQANLVSIGDLPYTEAALAEPMACVLNGVQTIGVEGVDTAMVFGAGPIGLLMAIALRIKGVPAVTLVDIDSSRLQFAKSMGFGGLLSGDEALAGHHHGMDLVVDATGVAAVAEGLINYAVDGGKVLFFGVCAPDVKINIAPFEVFRRQITLAGAHSLNRNIGEAIDVIRSFGPDIRKLVSHELALDEIPAFLDGSNRADSLKVQAVW